MTHAPRIYDAFLDEHLRSHRQMAFVSGPRQVGKTTTCRQHATQTLNWDNDDHRETILAGAQAIAAQLGIHQLAEQPETLLLDEIHKYNRWKKLLKGLFDTHADQLKIIVSGSSRLDVYQRVGDSLMGRYFLYRMHPFSVAETLHADLPDPAAILRQPHKPGQTEFDALWEHGGFPEPFLKRDPRFTRRWQILRTQQLLREDVRDQTRIQQLDQLEHVARLLNDASGQQLVYSSIAKHTRVSVDTARRWIKTLSDLHHGFLIKPWHSNIQRSLRKEPKWFLRDWSNVSQPGPKAETFVACHLLKAVEGWNDLGLGSFQLAYLRDKDQHEVDFIVIRDNEPWMLVEVKMTDTKLSPALAKFQKQTGAPYALQVVISLDYVNQDCFKKQGRPGVVPAQTFLSQLL
ncbi:ATP-binding protein [Mucisphaera calidilacus]|uniref:ATP-binding protein n=1 Tax=Mucisphaera calidilacus TaxID=2527982 RepID=A0A518C162_9BACT|nr:ATP-binding protein [Mucisphaera calidilacus]QDU72950.1 hypothetical protein Pan265_28270 [Mucisphaera calidilacus]